MASDVVSPPPRRHRHHYGMKRLCEDETELLIALVQRRPCLWNENHAEFKNTVLRRQLWEGVASHLRITGDEAKCKWKNLKDKFRKLRHVQEEKSTAGIYPSEPKWRFYNSLLFIKENSSSVPENADGTVIKTEVESDYCASGDSNDNASSLSSDVDVDFEIDVPSTDNNNQVRESNKSACSREPVAIPSPSTQQSQGDRDFQGRGTKRKRGNESSKIEAEDSRRSQEDSCKRGDYHFLMSLLPYVEVLDPLEKLDLRFRIQSLVTDSFKKHVSNKKLARTRQIFIG